MIKIVKAVIITSIFMLFFNFNASAQLKNATIAPNFDVIDINGQEYDLYSILNERKIVILDFYTTWCEPCWTLHENGTLKDIWNQYGPQGTDEVFVISLESDIYTTPEDLNGTGSNTLGDWVTDVPYPLIDETGALELTADLYEVPGYPTIYFICPDRLVTEDSWKVVDEIFQQLYNGGCAELNGNINANLAQYNGFEKSVCDEVTFTPEIILQNLGEEDIISAKIDLSVDGDIIEEIDWTGILVPYDLTTVQLPELTVGASKVEADIVLVNGVQDDFDDNNNYISNITTSAATSSDSVIIELKTHFGGGNTYWVLLNENDEIVAEGGNPAVGLDNVAANIWEEPPLHPESYDANTLYREVIYLPQNGCYTFVVTDFNGQGLCCLFGSGFYNIISGDGESLIAGDPDFGYKAEDVFVKMGTTDIDELSIRPELQISPNPFTDLLEITALHHGAELKKLTLTNLIGEVIRTENFTQYGNESITLDLSFLNAGAYLLLFEKTDGSLHVENVIKQ